MQSPRVVLAVLIGMMIVLGVLIARNSQAQSQARSRAEVEGNALMAMQRAGATLLDLETGQRGYILTRDPAYLQPFDAARAVVEERLSEVKRQVSVSADPEDAVHLSALAALVPAKLRELDFTVSMAREGNFDVAASVIRSNYGKAGMDAIRAHLEGLSAGQARRRQAAFDHARAVERGLLPMIVLLWGLILLLGWASLIAERRRALAQARAAQAEVLREANDRVNLLAGELDHRVKNLFAVVLSIIKLSARKQAPAKEVTDDIAARVHALMQAHEAALARAGEGADLREVCRRTLAPYADADEGRVSLAGPDVLLPSRNTTPIALILHELATNAAKYGALTTESGRVSIDWRCEAGEAGASRIVIVWSETGGPALREGAGSGTGFGTRMTAMAAAQLGGTLERDWPAQGARVVVSFPH